MVNTLLWFSLLWGAFCSLCRAIDVIGTTGTLTISNAFLSPDGFNRSAIVVNGVHPSPLIRANRGDDFSVNVVNNLNDPAMLRSTSVHWHGLFHRTGTAWADGAAGVSQCPITPGRSFQYRFPTGNQTGTYWYHSHFGTQYCDGLRGPIVIYDDNDPHRNLYDVDNENTIITLEDWYHLPAPANGAGLSDATLINGKGRSPRGPQTELSVVSVEPGRRYRFRLVSLSCEPHYVFSIDGHRLTIIEADGELTEPVTVDSIEIFAGQRYSFILEATQPVDNYWIRALPYAGRNNLGRDFSGGINSAILRYAGAPSVDPASSQPRAPVRLDETMLHPLLNPGAPGPPAPGAADVNLILQLGFSNGRFDVNGTVFEPPDVPVLLQIMSGARSAAELIPRGMVYPLARNQVVELKVPGGLLGGMHPFHLHGHGFTVIRSASNTTYNFANPVRRDVVNLGDATSEVTIRFTTDNPGPWLFHCHVEIHLALGMAMIFAEDIDNVPSRSAVPDSWEELCPIYSALSPSETSISTGSAQSSAGSLQKVGGRFRNLLYFLVHICTATLILF